MFRTDWFRGVVLAIGASAWWAPTASMAQGGMDADTREVLAYVLTEAGLARYAQAARNLDALSQNVRGDCDDESDSQTLDETAARIDAVPGAKAAIQAAGMSTREYMVFSWSLLHHGLAAWAVSQPGGTLPPGASQANVDFYKQHEAAIDKLAELTNGGDCEEEDDSVSDQ